MTVPARFRNDFAMQRERGPIAIECHDPCARFHILAIHLERDRQAFSLQMEEQELANMERGEVIPEEITSNPVFQYMTAFRKRVQAASVSITKTSPLVVDAEARFRKRLFGPDTIDDIEALRGDLTIPEIIDSVSRPARLHLDRLCLVLALQYINAQATPESIASNTPKHSAFGTYPGDTLNPIATTSKVNSSGSMSFASIEDARAWSRSAVISSWSEISAQNTPSDTGGMSMPTSTLTPVKSTFSNILSTSNVFNAASSGTPPATSTLPESAFAALASMPNAFGTSFATSSSRLVISNDMLSQPLHFLDPPPGITAFRRHFLLSISTVNVERLNNHDDD
ncbi:uncharacterized protein LAESUDRAFT_765210 [Laetiporus sulphureus 93-53]|uniref:SAC3/GANP/THP3 conserved domain-containing protein n=1 Tax=Laetiporus sulphureus 93-53 TaxID=1314785 RepID=A0A165AW83_9APHY|nr:uncharacterized protein LAESUDRAFT_765210 [Laetiporus sulphureus 93-53]KZS99777.1 hypothetical protein LAESUDRAFT_765210 [Laetiporus sulphureus 93-53]